MKKQIGNKVFFVVMAVLICVAVTQVWGELKGPTVTKKKIHEGPITDNHLFNVGVDEMDAVMCPLNWSDSGPLYKKWQDILGPVKNRWGQQTQVVIVPRPDGKFSLLVRREDFSLAFLNTSSTREGLRMEVLKRGSPL